MWIYWWHDGMTDVIATLEVFQESLEWMWLISWCLLACRLWLASPGRKGWKGEGVIGMIWVLGAPGGDYKQVLPMVAGDCLFVIAVSNCFIKSTIMNKVPCISLVSSCIIWTVSTKKLAWANCMIFVNGRLHLISSVPIDDISLCTLLLIIQVVSDWVISDHTSSSEWCVGVRCLGVCYCSRKCAFAQWEGDCGKPLFVCHNQLFRALRLSSLLLLRSYALAFLKSW